MSEPTAPAPPEQVDPLPTVLVAQPPPQAFTVRFTGSGGEYFRIWIVNLLLTLVTLGVWSAWAKVRKTRYFWSNTQLAGAAFRYHGNPAAILRGRLIAAALFVAYWVSGHLSLQAGAVAGSLLTLASPWFLYKAMRFQLSNTSWRGLRLGFDSTAGEAYAVLWPALGLAFLVLGSASVLRPVKPGEVPNFLPFLSTELLAFALVPWLHARLKAWQHGRARYGSLAFAFEPTSGAFYGLYGKAFVIGVPFFAVFAVAMGAMVAASGAGKDPTSVGRLALPILALSYAIFGLAYLLSGAFFTARLQRLVWTGTTAGPARFTTAVKARGVLRVWLTNGLLTLVTAGLYWPWAAVAIARYRLECMGLETSAPLELVTAGVLPAERSTTGEGAVDLFGWDLGL